MKLKGINQFEQHVEKIALGVAVLIAVGIVVMQLLSAPEVKLGTQTVAPSMVDDRLERRAAELSSKMKSGGVSLDDVQAPTVAPDFEKALRADVAPQRALKQTSPNFNGRLVKAAAGGGTETWYQVPIIPALEMRGVMETADALPVDSAKAAKAASPAIAARPDFADINGPRDIVWTTPYARIDLKALRAALAQADPSASPPRAAVPSVWYQDTPYVVDVVFERRMRGSDGSWGQPETVPVFADRPEELLFRTKFVNAPIDLRDEVFALLGSEANQREILQPSFYDTVNDAFVSPSVEAESGADAAAEAVVADAGAARRRMQLRTELQRKQRQADVLRTELEKLGGIWDEDAEKRREKEEKERKKEEDRANSGSGSGGGAAGGGGGLGGAMSGKNNADEANAAREERKRQAERKSKSMVLRRLTADISSIEKELGVEPSAPAAPGAKAPTLATLDELLVWGHDMEVEAGRTYQYRCVARVYNPFFGKGNQLVRDQDATGISGAFTLDSVASGWSEPITVSPKVRFFVARSSMADGLLGMGSAQVEIYVLQGGRWIREDLSVQPGERIGRMDSSGPEAVDFTTDFFLLDIVEDLDPARGASGGSGKRGGIAIVAPVGGGPPDARVPANEMGSPDRLRLRMLAEAAKATADAGADDGKQGGAPGAGG